jgi:sugar (pentulose or hexulose) kinase
VAAWPQAKILEFSMPPYLIGIDIGSYESKGVLSDTQGSVLATSAIKHELQFLKPGFVEQDVEKVWWGRICRTRPHPHGTGESQAC